MKRLIFSVFFLTGISVNAQSNSEEIAIVQEAFGMEKKEVVNDFIMIDGDDASTFWKIYDEFEDKRKENGKKLILVLDKYSSEFNNLDDASAKKITKDMMFLRDANNKLLNKYFKKIDKQCGSKYAVQFYQLESYFQSLVRLTIMDQIPFVGE